MMLLERTLTTELLNNAVELKDLPVGVFIFFLTCMVYSGEGGCYYCLAPSIYKFFKQAESKYFHKDFLKF